MHVIILLVVCFIVNIHYLHAWKLFSPPTKCCSWRKVNYIKAGNNLKILSPTRLYAGATSDKPRPPRKAKADCLLVTGKVLEVLPNASFRVELQPTKKVIVCMTAGKIRKYHVRVIAGDEVEVELSAYDLTKGRIVFRNIVTKTETPS